MKFLLRLIFVFIFFSSSQFAQPNYSLLGTVIEKYSGKPLKSVSIIVKVDNDSLVMFTDSLGNYSAEFTPTTLKEEPVPAGYELISQNYPNPFNPSTIIMFSREGRFVLFDINGQKIISEDLSTGNKDIPVRLAAGVYLYSFNSGGKTSVKKMILLDGSNAELNLVYTKHNKKLEKKRILIQSDVSATYKLTKENFVELQTTKTLTEGTNNEYNFQLEYNYGPCGNGLGNGDEIVDGPDGPIEPEDHDQIFRSLSVYPGDSDNILTGTERNGFVKSIDGGNNWMRYRYGLRHTEPPGTINYPEVYDISIDPNNSSVIYAATVDSPGPVTDNYPSSIGGVYKSTDSGEMWFRTNCGLINSRVTSIRVHPVNSNIVVLGQEGGYPSFTGSDVSNQYFDGGLYRSTNGGEEWTKLIFGNSNDVENGFWQIETYGNGNFISFGTWSHQNESGGLEDNVGFVKSTDGGETWFSFGESLRTKDISHFTVSNNGQIIYASESGKYFFHKSTDSGNTWSQTNIVQGHGALAISPSDPSIVIYAGYNVLYRTTDGFQTYQQIFRDDKRIDDIVFSKSDPNVVYVGTTGYNIYKSADGGATFNLITNLRANVLNH